MEIKRVLERPDFERMVWGSDPAVAGQMKKHFDVDLRRGIDGLFTAYQEYVALDKDIGRDIWKANICGQLFSAVNHLGTGMNLFVQGYVPAAVNQMRMFNEATAMALLFSNRNIPSYENYMRDPLRFPVHKVIVKLERYKKMLGLTNGGVESAKKIWDLCDTHSHSTVIVQGHIFNFANKGIVIGPHFDEEKLPIYTKLVKLFASSGAFLSNVIYGVKMNMVKPVGTARNR